MEIPRGSHQIKPAEVASFRLDRARSQCATQVISRRVDGTTKRLTRVWRIREEEVAVWRCDGELLESLQCEARRRDPRPRIPEDFVIRILDLCGNEQLRVKHSNALRASFIEVQRLKLVVLLNSKDEDGDLHEFCTSQGLQEPLQFTKKFQNQVRDSSERLREKWYSNLARAAKGALGVPPSEHSRLLRCLCCLVAVQVRELQRRSLLHILEIFSRDVHIPRFELRAELLPSGRIALEPSEQELAAALHSLLHAVSPRCTVSNSAQQLPRLGTDHEDESLIPVRLDDTFLSEAHADLTRAFDQQLSGVHEHLKELETSFNPLYGEKTAQEQAEFLSGGSHDFEVLSERVHQLRGHLMRVLAEPPSADFPIASLDKRELLVELQRRAKALVQNVVSVMESQHQKECRSICAQFRAVAARAEATPGCTEELMTTGDFMENAEKNLMSELEQRIGVAAHQMAFLMQLRYLSPQHTSLINEAEVDMTYRKAMRVVEDDPIVMSHAARHGVLEDFARCSEHLETVNQGVTSYLELKRQAFPRFFFLSNEEILSVVSESKDPRRLERFLGKCFPGAHGTIWKESGHLVALEGSVPGQRLPLLDHEVTWHVAGRVETWLQQVELSMVKAMKLQLVGCLNDSGAMEDRSNWARRWPVQVVLAIIRSKWTSSVEASLKSPTRSPLSKLLETLQARVKVGCVALRGEVAAEERCALEALVTADCHAAEVTKSLTKAAGLQDFAWVSQLRFYSSGGGTVFQGRLMYTNLDYGWEFLGDTSAGIVVTPHTLRCLRALVTAHRMEMGTCLQGPAGSGKSAAVAALAIALGKFLVSVTCSPAMDHRAIAKAIQGAAGTGAWLVLEDVQRLTPGTLSVASQHLLELSRACDSSLEALCLRGYGPVPLSPQRCLVCLSAQPDSRTLPTNLRSLFRPVYVDEADMMFVCRIRLLCYGFQESATLASQLTELLRLCRQLLNPLPHYSFGMCAALRVVAEAGQLLREVSDEDEVVVICGGARRVLLPFLVQADHSRFLALLRDMFGAVSENAREVVQSDFTDAILKECEARLFQPTELFVRKVMETRDVLQVSRGIALVGETFSGKTAVIQVLQGTMQRLGINVKCARISPKALSLVQLFGEFDPHTAEWRDGVVTKTLREMGNSEDIGWLVLDGPVEASWAETLHAALDDSQRLSLPSGEIINIKDRTSIILEAGDLSQASPGTVSRCGCIHFSASSLGWRAPLRSWLREHEKAGTLWAQRTEGNLVFDLLDWMVPPCERFLERHGKRLVKPGTNNLVRTTSNIFAMLLREACSDPEAPKHIKIWIQAAMMSAGAWAFGGTLELRSKEAFDEMFKTLWKGMNSENPLPSCLEGKVDVAVPSEGLLIDHSFMFKFKGAWKHWPDALRSLKMDEKPSLHDLTVPTMDTARYLWMLGMHVEASIPTLLVGGSDTGKSTLARHLLLERLSAKRQPLLLRLTHLTSATALQEEFTGQLSKRADGGLGPAPGRDSCVVFIDDLGVPRREKGGAQPPLELLRQMVDHRAWLEHFSLLFHDCELVPIEALLVMGALSPNLHTPVCPRLLRHFSLLGLSAPADETLVRIFATVLNFALKNNGFASDVAAVASAMVQSTLETVRSLSAQLRRMPGRGPHLRALGLRDVQRVILGCAQVQRAVRENFKEQPSAVFEQLPRGEDGQVTSETLEALVFLRGFKGGGYAEVNSERELHNRMQAALDDFNTGSDPSLDIFTRRVVWHVCSDYREEARCYWDVWDVVVALLSTSRLISVGIESSRRHQQHHILRTSETILRDIHCVLSEGHVPGLFSLEERQDIMEAVMLDAQGGKRNVDLSPMFVFNFFASRCQDRLHWAICLDPESPNFHSWLRKYPALLSHSTPINFPEWPASALGQISARHAAALNVKSELRAPALRACQHFHCTAKELSERFAKERGRIVEIGARSYVELMQLSCALLETRQVRTQRDRHRYIVGLEKLQLAATQVQRIQEELGALQPRLADAAMETNGMLEVIETETQKVCEASLLVRRDEAVANVQAAGAQDLKSECETELAQAIPILEDAVAALNTLKPTDITLVKSMKNPPEPIKLVMAADNIQTATIAKIRRDFIPHPDFRPDVVANASSAAEGLCKWVRAMDMYDAVAKEVAPKKVKLEAAQQEYAATLAVLEEKRAQVRRLERQLAELQAQFHAANLHKQQLEAEFRACAHKLKRAEKLIGGLGGERERWAATSTRLQADLDTLLGDVLLAKLGVPCSPQFDFCRVMGSPLRIEQWNLAGLPRDMVSTQNALIAQHSLRVCLAIDPQRQAVTWMRNLESGRGLRELRFPSMDFSSVVSECAATGVPVLVAELGENDVASLVAALREMKLPVSKGTEAMSGDEEQEDQRSGGFRLFLATPQSQPQLAPEVYCHAAVIDFTLPTEELAEKQARAEQTLREIAEFRDEHSELARDAAAVFDTLSGLPALNSTLAWRATERPHQTKEDARVFYSQDLYDLYVLRARGEATKAELDFLLSCAPSNVVAEEQPKSDEQPPEGMSAETWRRVCRLEQLPEFEGSCPQILIAGFSARVRMDVNKYLQLEDVEDSDSSPLKGLLLTATFAPQKLAERACSLADQQLRLEELNGSTVLPAALEHSSCTTPLVCVLGEGADVTAQLFPLAERAECTSLAVISMAPDQGKHAAAEIAAAQKRGTWVCLLNCHLAGTWLRELERLCEPSDPQKINSSFRLWITCDADQQLPPRVVQCSVKVAVEAAAGLRGAACQALLLQAARMEECAGRESTFCRLAFGLSVLHARLLGRKQLGPLADAPFDLQNADLDLASRHLWSLCSEHRRVPLEAAAELVGESCYLARARGAWEKRTLRLLLNDCISATLLSLTRKPDNARQLRAPYIPTLETCLKHLQGFPERAEPEEYGLHARSGVARELIASNLLLDDAARLLNPSTANGQAIDSAKHRTGLRDTALWLLQQLPDLGDGMSSSPSRPTPVTVTRSSVEEAMQVRSSRGGSDVALTRQGSSRRTLHAKSSEGGTDSAATTLEGSPADVTSDVDPLSAARTFESTQLTRSVLAVKADLEGILMALDGGSELVGPLTAVARDLAFHRVPEAWSSLHSGLATPTLPAFVSHIQSRALALQEWVGGGALWLGGLARPDMILAALRQFHARATATSITRITLDFRLLDSDISTAGSSGEELPTYECPLYCGPGRRNVLTSVHLPSDPNILPEHWTRRGVALFLLAPCHVDAENDTLILLTSISNPIYNACAGFTGQAPLNIVCTD
ncbi:hypothetical protein B566_EDAN002504 [Ephemera danica]|nr:hypothetical protein B566_EDAN002504 [Ephemera danica]